MRPSAAEALKAAIRRAIPLTIVLVVFGIVAMNVVKQAQGPRYAADAKVALQTRDLGAMLTGIDPGFQDPEREAENALALARSPEVYRRAAEDLDDPDLTASDLRAMTTVSGRQESDILTFTTQTDDSDEAIAVADAVAASYVDWRADISAGAIRTAIQRVQAELDSGAGPQAQLQADLQRLRTLETLNSGGATVIERPTEADQVSPAPIRDSLLGGAIGLVVALLVAAVREALNTRVRSEGDVEDMLGKPVLATIHSLPRRVGLVTVGRHETRYGDTYGLLAATLMQISGEKPGRVLAVTSAVAGEGKTTTATNLAVALALRGQNVVLADFDTRKPSLGGFFRIPEASPGVRQLVDGEARHRGCPLGSPAQRSGAQRARGAARIVVGQRERPRRPTSAGWLRVVPSGGHERGARVARSARIPALLADLGEDADLVILDTPPALSTVEMAELAPHVDFVLVVVRHGRVTRRSLQTLSRQAEGWRSEIIGAVITDSPPDSDEYYYYATK